MIRRGARARPSSLQCAGDVKLAGTPHRGVHLRVLGEPGEGSLQALGPGVETADVPTVVDHHRRLRTPGCRSCRLLRDAPAPPGRRAGRPARRRSASAPHSGRAHQGVGERQAGDALRMRQRMLERQQPAPRLTEKVAAARGRGPRALPAARRRTARRSISRDREGDRSRRCRAGRRRRCGARPAPTPPGARGNRAARRDRRSPGSTAAYRRPRRHRPRDTTCGGHGRARSPHG